LVVLDHRRQRTFVGRQAADIDRLAHRVPQLLRHHQVTDRGDIGASHFERFFDRRGELFIASLAADADQLHHGSRARLAADFGNLSWPTSAVCFGPPCGLLMLRVLGSAGA
jgi:hypothetical protein